ncbi:adenosylcobinamide-GDP ribazoletransferase [Catelliglobosispora koreensis]|uniref:adenosylcobinamide-GDP ribazoletransferase n=1 Tax=Catelliglobosispora koreensis TaxID=129052 RepID=UPI0003A55EF5|nr:adenosylcobinamide-GDP ribazoletransferase [Catelliglobosispora koreensis]
MWTDGLRLALTTFTVAPLRPPAELSRVTASWAMRFAPAVGALLGSFAGGLLWTFRFAGLPPLLAGALTVGALALLTRGMHLDGLADTVDGLGSYRSRDQALAIMKKPDVGAFGVVALVLTVLIQSAAFAVVSIPGVVVAVATGRLAAVIACRRGVAAARPDGLGAFVAGSVGWPAIAANTAFVLILGVLSESWKGIAAVLVAASLTFALLAHIKRRLGGITGDVLGFLIEAATTIVLIGLSLPRL